MKVVYLSLGSNLGDRLHSLIEAVERLNAPGLAIQRISAVYETAPIGLEQQPAFLNIVVEAETSLFPMRLLNRILGVETRMGRRRTVLNGPRTIDIDILLFGSFCVSSPRLEIPHPRMTERRFVLEPLAELATDLRHPRTRRTVREHLQATLAQKVHKTSLIVPVPQTIR